MHLRGLLAFLHDLAAAAIAFARVLTEWTIVTSL